MISEVSIQNLKGIKECNIDGLDRINVFIGKNDVCKSTILEAIYYPLKEFTSPNLLEIIGRRTNVFFGARELWFNYDMKYDVSVALEFDNEATATFQIVRGPRGPRGDFEINCKGTAKFGTKKTTTDLISVYRVVNWKLEKKVDHRTDFVNNLSAIAGVKTKEYVSNCQFLDSSNRNNISYIESLFGSIKSHGETSMFNKYVRTIFEKGSNVRIKFAKAQPGDTVERRVVMEELMPPLKRKVFVSGFGDGVRFGMQTIGTALIARNTGMFIEEIESNQHPGSLRRIIDFLMDISFRNKLQLFVTTHNVRAFRFFWYHFRKTEHKVDPRAHNVKYFHVTRDNGTGEVNCRQVDPHNAQEMSKVELDLFGS